MEWREMPAWQTLTAALAFLVPLLVGAGTWFASPILLAGLFVQTLHPASEHIAVEKVG
jgi:hypothetical protein